MIDEAIAASLAEVERRETGGELELPERLLDSVSNTLGAPDVSEGDYEDNLTLPDASAETEQAMASTRIA